MPYIDQEAREALTLAGAPAVTPGELNYVITRIILEHLEIKGTSYTTMNTIVGVLEQVKDEFQRRIVHPYEDQKKEENGDVYPGSG